MIKIEKEKKWNGILKYKRKNCMETEEENEDKYKRNWKWNEIMIGIYVPSLFILTKCGKKKEKEEEEDV